MNFKDSTFKLRPDDIQFINNCFDNKPFATDILYRGSDHGFTASAIHNKCDNRGPTLAIVKSDNEQVFGGFTNVCWDENN